MTTACALAVLVLAACDGRAPAPAAPLSPAPTPPSPARQEKPTVPQLPTCTSGADLARFDGQRVVLVGVYRKQLEAKKQGKPATHFYGYVQIELTGKATDYDPSAWDGARAMVDLGTDKRPADEIDRLTDKPVRVEGRLVLHPPIADPSAASALPGPTLYDLGEVSPR